MRLLALVNPVPRPLYYSTRNPFTGMLQRKVAFVKRVLGLSPSKTVIDPRRLQIVE